MPRSMQYTVVSLLTAILLFLLGGLLEYPVAPSRNRADIGPGGERVLRPKTDAEMQADRLRGLRINRPAHACSTAGWFLLGSALVSASWGVVSVIRRKRTLS
jgi:hypothetical protein